MMQGLPGTLHLLCLTLRDLADQAINYSTPNIINSYLLVMGTFYHKMICNDLKSFCGSAKTTKQLLVLESK